jgi:hypothetical protein
MKLTKSKKKEMEDVIQSHKNGKITYNEAWEFVQSCGYSKEEAEIIVHPPLGERDLQMIPEENLEGILPRRLN